MDWYEEKPAEYERTPCMLVFHLFSCKITPSEIFLEALGDSIPRVFLRLQASVGL